MVLAPPPVVLQWAMWAGTGVVGLWCLVVHADLLATTATGTAALVGAVVARWKA